MKSGPLAMIVSTFLAFHVLTGRAVALSEPARDQLINALTVDTCEPIPVGNVRWSNGRFLSPDATSIERFLKAGIVVAVEEGELGGGDKAYDIRLAVPEDGVHIRRTHRGLCAQLAELSGIQVDVVREEPVEGGLSHWKGSIEYVRLIIGSSDLEIALFPERATADGISLSLRVLVRQDPFDQHWNFVAYDTYLPLTGIFESDRVPQALTRD